MERVLYCFGLQQEIALGGSKEGQTHEPSNDAETRHRRQDHK